MRILGLKQNLLVIKERARLMLLQWIIPHSKYSNCKVLSKGLTKLLQNNQQQTQLPQVPQFVPQIGQQGTQEHVNTLPQATNGQGSTTPQRGRGGRGGYRGRGGRGRGGLMLCYWCRDFLPKEQANHKVAQCPYQKQAKEDWWKNQLSTVQGHAQVTQPNVEEN